MGDDIGSKEEKRFAVAEESEVVEKAKERTKREEERRYSVIHSKSRKNMPSLERKAVPAKNLYPVMAEETVASSRTS